MKARQYGLLGSGVLALAIAIGWYAFSSPLGASKAPVKLTAQSTGKLQCDLPAPDAASPHPGMVWVPAGKFDMGDSVYPEEKPVRNVEVKGFWMDRTEVTNQEFEAFVKATSYVTVAERPVDPKYHASLPEAMRQAGAVVFKMPDKLTQGDDPRQWWQYIPGANAWGLFDMVSNAWELTADVFVAERSAANYCMRYRAGSRQPQEEDLAVSHLGFRTIRQP